MKSEQTMNHSFREIPTNVTTARARITSAVDKGLRILHHTVGRIFP